ncbi:asparagine synthase (glutamine-hydrolyzing) [Pontivivens insulae]|uniref:asparagine synthase (glutamine-hydrolyzing) n=1 Tax=Pontivivens insulae TaxID=1639689 RepID=A0A2R8A7F0_9RHOB|nr:asparagine synthase (glutamine-hydrolyzing) [Pontivivens insulae]RED18261.1 asparagine synthase (glutamine-hydrolysing) [Pontivivens insulae]SPF28159.1 Asparagine synthetase [glutamine-hydrolyzing] 1 [Pontivivens insulae]
MCGISGYSGDAPIGFLERAVRSQRHRGPDAEGYFEAKGIGLGHNRLAILDLSSAGAQPMVGPGGQTRVAYNGEIYNFRDLRAELQANGALFKSESDTEVILHLYERDGAAFLEHLNGIFAIALWDPRDGNLLLATDRMGVKPLYYIERDGLVAFASELKALTELSDLSLPMDPSCIARYLSYLWSPGADTPAPDIKLMSPGSALSVKDGHVERKWTWHRPISGFSTLQTDATDKLVTKTRSLVRQASLRQMVSDVPVGAFLSGGLDSSAIVAFAREASADLPCFTIRMTGGQDDDQTDDLPYAERVARHLGVDLSVVEVSPDRLAQDVERMIGQLDEPLADPAALNVSYICEQAKSAGISVLLSGTGGDDLFSGYRRHQAIEAERYWTWMPRSARAALRRGSGIAARNSTRLRRVAKLFENADASDDERLIAYFRWTAPEKVKALLSTEMRGDLAREVDAPLQTYMDELPPSLTRMSQALALEQRFFLADHNLIYTDKMSMAHGVEVRVPFLDNDLVTFSQGLPDDVRVRKGQAKWILKKAMEAELPHDVIYRPKTGFGVPLRRWMTHDLLPLLNDTLSHASLRKRGIFDADAVHRLIAQNQRGEIDASYTLFSVLSIELWHRAFRDPLATTALASQTGTHPPAAH